MKMSKLLALLLRPFMLYAEGDEGGGGAADNAGGGEESSSSSVDWSDLNSGVDAGSDDDESEEGETPAGEVEGESTAAKPEGKSADDPATGKDPVDPKSEEGEAADPQAPVISDEQQLTPEQVAARDKQIAEDFAKWEQAETARLSEVYAFDEETSRRLQTEPELVLPQIAAKLHIAVMKNTLEAVQRMLPQVVPHMMQQQGVEKTAMDTFYGANPDLKKYHSQVLQAGKMFRKLNPKAGPDEAAKKIGAMVRSALGLEPLAPAAEKPAAKSKAAPHKPAASGTGSGVKPAAKAKPAADLWGQMAADDDD